MRWRLPGTDGTTLPEPAVAERIRLRQMVSLIRQTPIMAATHLINAVLAGSVLLETVSWLLVGGWVGLIWLSWGMLLVRWWRRRERPPPKTVRPSVIRRAVVRSALAGSLWGFAGLVMFPADSLSHQLILTFVIGGMCAGAVAAMSNFPAACQAYILTSMMPLTLRFLLVGETISLAMGTMTIVYTAALLIVSRNGFRTFLDSIRTEIELSERVAELEDMKVRLETQGKAQRRLTRNLALARDEANAANKAKSNFLANMSHELRTPLNAIIGFSEVMMGELLGPLGAKKYREYAQGIHRSGAHLLSLINDILDLSKIEAGGMELSEERVDLHGSVEAAVRIISERAQVAGVQIEVSLPSDLRYLLADTRAIQQILLNLLSNAVKFTESGGRVEVRAGLTEAGALAITIADTGLGMSKEEIEKALAPFGQVDSSLSRKHDGTGLGLPLVKSLAELHQGTLVIESAPRKGTTVTVTMPAQRVLPADSIAERGRKAG